MSDPIQVSKPMLDILELLLLANADGDEPDGWTIMRSTGRSGPAAYKVIDELEDRKWVSGRWDENTAAGKPRRRLYVLTPDGAENARRLLGHKHTS